MNKIIFLMMVLGCVYAAHAEPVEKAADKETVKPAEKKEAAKPSSPVVFTEAARAELKNQKNKKWLISYNGTCGDAPALGFYPDDGGSDSKGLLVKQEGAVICIEQKVVALFDEWGSVTVDCTDYNGDKPGGKQFTAEFKKDAINE